MKVSTSASKSAGVTKFMKNLATPDLCCPCSACFSFSWTSSTSSCIPRKQPLCTKRPFLPATVEAGYQRGGVSILTACASWQNRCSGAFSLQCMYPTHAGSLDRHSRNPIYTTASCHICCIPAMMKFVRQALLICSKPEYGVRHAWLDSWGLDRHAIHRSLMPKMVYSKDAACCVACREMRLGRMKPSTVEITCTGNIAFKAILEPSTPAPRNAEPGMISPPEHGQRCASFIFIELTHCKLDARA